MLSKLRSHARDNVVGYIAVFIALSGTRSPVLRDPQAPPPIARSPG